MAAPLFRRGDVVGQKYVVLTKSGETALWVGFLATDLDRHKTASEQGEMPEPSLLLKVVRPELLDLPGAADKLTRHLTTYKDLSHPFLAQIVDVVALPEQRTLAVAETVSVGPGGQGGQGVLLDRMVAFRQKEGLPLSDVLQIIDQLAEALLYLHEQGFCHGDLRLESVLLKTDGVRLCDVGLAIGLPREPYLLQLGSVGQMESVAPELHAARPPDVRTDVFGLAKVMRSLCELGENWALLSENHKTLVDVLEKATAQDPAERPLTISALVGEMETALKPEGPSGTTAQSASGSEPPVNPEASSAESTSRRSSRSPKSSRSSLGGELPPGSVLVSWRAFFATVLLAALVGALFSIAAMLLLRSRHDTPRPGRAQPVSQPSAFFTN